MTNLKLTQWFRIVEAVYGLGYEMDQGVWIQFPARGREFPFLNSGIQLATFEYVTEVLSGSLPPGLEANS
jgi:hypothetical protein